ncbi:MAG: 4a-hydroxytetrahydrobiopterin dehydratase [Verrucomicrobiae bacterium]|nr:4a-hydroxytetrahydrobiopterin dehydratase [Verrucomicrobiae bacterium]
MKLASVEIKAARKAVPNWAKRGATISRTFVFKDFREAMKFVNAVAKIAERDRHHPDIDVRWNKVTLALTTHDVGGLTQNDFDLAQKFNRL